MVQGDMQQSCSCVASDMDVVVAASSADTPPQNKHREKPNPLLDCFGIQYYTVFQNDDSIGVSMHYPLAVSAILHSALNDGALPWLQPSVESCSNLSTYKRLSHRPQQANQLQDSGHTVHDFNKNQRGLAKAQASTRTVAHNSVMQSRNPVVHCCPCLDGKLLTGCVDHWHLLLVK